MKKVLLIIFVTIIGFIIIGVIVGMALDGKKGMVHVISVDPSDGSTVGEYSEIKIKAFYIFWESSPKIDLYAGLYFNSTYYVRYRIEEKKLPSIIGVVEFKTNLKDVMCGLDPIVRESNTSREIAEKLFNKYVKKGMMGRFQKELVRLENCKYGKIKYPFELVVQTIYKFKGVEDSRYGVDKSDITHYEVNQ